MSDQLSALLWWKKSAMGFEYSEYWKNEAEKDGLCLIPFKGPGNDTPVDTPEINYTHLIILYRWVGEYLGEEHYVIEINRNQSWILFSSAADAVLWKFEWAEYLKKELSAMGRYS